MRKGMALAVWTLTVLAALAWWRPVQAASLVVTTLTDEADGSCSDGDCSLRDALALAAPGDTISFSVVGTITLSVGELTIGKSLTIAGPGADRLTLDAGGAHGVISITPSYAVVSISGLTVANGNSGSRFGGGIFNYNIMGGSTLTVSNCRFVNNRSSGDGGAISSKGPTTIVASTFQSNSAGGAGGDGGAIQASFRSLTVTAGTFISNTASGHGGAISIDDFSQPNVFLRVDGSEFRGNTSGAYGGAVSAVADASIRRSVFVSNGGKWGGALRNDRVSTIEDSLFYTNTATTSTGANDGTALGGAIYDSGTLSVANTTIYSNTASVGGGMYSSFSTPLLLNSTVFANRARYNGPSLSGAFAARNTIIGGGSFMNGASNNCSDGLSSSSASNLVTDATCGTAAGVVTQTTAIALALSWQAPALRLTTGSVAIDAGNNATCTSRDQLGWPRPYDGNADGNSICDIGAHEYVPNLRQVFLPVTLRQVGP
jgi:CSLREA domain-containing protein